MRPGFGSLGVDRTFFGRACAGGDSSLLGFRRWKRARLRRRPLGEAQRRTLESRVGWVKQLPPGARQELEGLVQIFLAEKRFEGCGGLVVSDEMRLIIATHACILLLGRDADVYPGLYTVLVYPHAYVARVRSSHGGIVTEGTSVRLGESWRRGSLVLAWDHVLQDAGDIHDGHNVVFHEFAHLLDLQDGTADGTPPLPSRSRYLAWARVLGDAYADLTRRIERHRPSVLDAYGTTNPAEFFAVATECFFEKPRRLERAYPELYSELRRFYRRDPAALERGDPERLE
jgi:Mlc titration factor MtfA (ptsG expression regulator)